MSTSYYKHCLSVELQELYTKQLRKLIPEQLALNEEVAIHKSRVADTVEEWSNARDLYKQACTLPLNTPDRDILIGRARMNMDAAAEGMANSFRNHKDLALTAVQVESKSRETLTERTLLLLINSVIDLVHEEFNDGTGTMIKRLEDFEGKLRDRVIIQEADSNSLAVEGELWSMMQTIEGPVSTR